MQYCSFGDKVEDCRLTGAPLSDMGIRTRVFCGISNGSGRVTTYDLDRAERRLKAVPWRNAVPSVSDQKIERQRSRPQFKSSPGNHEYYTVGLVAKGFCASVTAWMLIRRTPLAHRARPADGAR